MGNWELDSLPSFSTADWMTHHVPGGCTKIQDFKINQSKINQTRSTKQDQPNKIIQTRSTKQEKTMEAPSVSIPQDSTNNQESIQVPPSQVRPTSELAVESRKCFLPLTFSENRIATKARKQKGSQPPKTKDNNNKNNNSKNYQQHGNRQQQQS